MNKVIEIRGERGAGDAQRSKMADTGPHIPTLTGKLYGLNSLASEDGEFRFSNVPDIGSCSQEDNKSTKVLKSGR